MPDYVSLRDVLAHPENLPARHRLYLPEGEAWTFETKGLVLDPNTADEDEDLPPAAKSAALQPALGVREILSVIRNLRSELLARGRGEPQASEVLQAFLFYFDNDAFIDPADLPQVD